MQLGKLPQETLSSSLSLPSRHTHLGGIQGYELLHPLGARGVQKSYFRDKTAYVY